jgi:hypothetical protein
MFDGHARLRAVERGQVCAYRWARDCPTCSRARITRIEGTRPAASSTAKPPRPVPAADQHPAYTQAPRVGPSGFPVPGQRG